MDINIFNDSTASIILIHHDRTEIREYGDVDNRPIDQMNEDLVEIKATSDLQIMYFEQTGRHVTVIMSSHESEDDDVTRDVYNVSEYVNCTIAKFEAFLENNNTPEILSEYNDPDIGSMAALHKMEVALKLLRKGFSSCFIQCCPSTREPFTIHVNTATMLQLNAYVDTFNIKQAGSPFPAPHSASLSTFTGGAIVANA